MSVLHTSQHLFSSVERGYFPKHGRGFQTVAITPDLQGTEDLARLEDLSFYALSREARAAENKPVKEIFFKLPSGKFAIGRTVYAGTDSLGREGNYITHHVIFEEEGFDGDVFAVLAALREIDAPSDLKPRELSKLTLKISDDDFDFAKLEDVHLNVWAKIFTLVLGETNKPILLIGESAPLLIEALFKFLLREECNALFFSTHFYESDSLRGNFKIVAVAQRNDAPSSLENYLEIDLTTAESNPVGTRRTQWLAECIANQRWEEIENLNATVVAIRSKDIPKSLPLTAMARGVLRDLTGDDGVRAMFGKMNFIREHLNELSVAKDEKGFEKLMNSASPTVLLGVPSDEAQSAVCLMLIRKNTSVKAWRNWQKQNPDDVCFALLSDEKKWWKFWQ